MTRLAPAVLALVAATAGCTDDLLPPVVNFADAIAMPGCGPADGGAVSIYLTNQPIVSDAPSAPFLRVDIWRTLSELNSETFQLGPNSQSATAHYYTGDDPPTPIPAAGGSVSIHSASAENGIHGEVNTVIPDHGLVRGTFNARWIATRSTLDLCG